MVNPIVGLMAALWRNDKSVRKWHLPRPCATFRDKHNKIQDQLKALSCMDELLSGKHFFMYSSLKRYNTTRFNLEGVGRCQA